MGIRGTRKSSNKNEYKEPNLLAKVEDVIQKARENGYYQGESLKIDDLIKTFNDIEVHYVEMEPSKSGSLKKQGDIWILTVNKNHHKRRQNFTLAHELGHYFLHKENNIEFEDSTFFRSDNMDSLEYAANDYAAQLLMPEDRVRYLIDNEKIKNIGDLAAKFGVSSAAMKYRALSLGYKMKENG